MRKFWFLAVLCLVVAKAYGVNNLQIDGSLTPTIENSSTFELTFSFEQADADAKGIIYLDVNGDGVLDAGDKWLFKRKLMDGMFNDEDELAEGTYHEICDPLKFSGKFLFFAEDNGVSDYVPLDIDPITSDFSVSGTIGTPANQAGLLVCLVEIIDEMRGEFEYGYGDFTDATGHFSIGVPADKADQWWKIGILDIAVMAPDYAGNDLAQDSVLIDGHVNRDMSMRLVGADTSTVYGVFKDNTGSPLLDAAPVLGLSYCQGTSPRWPRPWKNENDGTYRVPLKRAAAGSQYALMVSAVIVDQFYGEYMDPAASMTYGFGPSPSQLNLDLVAYIPNTTITGHVYLNGEPYDKCKLYCNSTDTKGSSHSKSYSDGRYEMPVASAAASYNIGVLKSSIPEGGYVVPAFHDSIAPGATGINFNVFGIEESPSSGKTFLAVWPNPFSSKLVFALSGPRSTGDLTLYDIAGNCVATIEPAATAEHETSFTLSRALPTGIYFYSVAAGNEVFRGKVIKLQ
jgi:hypothetical protein